MKIIYSFTFILFLSIIGFSQEKTVVIKKSTALAAQKAFAEVRESRILIAQLEADAKEFEVKETTYKVEIKAKDDQLAGKDAVIQGKDAQILALKNQKCDTNSFLFGFIKFKHCG